MALRQKERRCARPSLLLRILVRNLRGWIRLLSITVRNGLVGIGIALRDIVLHAARDTLRGMESAFPVAGAVEALFLAAPRIRRCFPVINSATTLAQAEGQDALMDQPELITMERSQVIHLTSPCSIMVSGLGGIGIADRITVSLVGRVSS